MLENCDFIVIFPIYGQVGGIRKPDSRTWPIKLLLSLIVAFRLTKTENRPKKSLRSNTIALSKGVEFAKNMLLQKPLRHWCIIIKTLFKVLSIIIIRCCKDFGHTSLNVCFQLEFLSQRSPPYIGQGSWIRLWYLFNERIGDYLAFLMQFLSSKFSVKFSQLEYCKDLYHLPKFDKCWHSNLLPWWCYEIYWFLGVTAI